jgi:hypothetical protein
MTKNMRSGKFADYFGIQQDVYLVEGFYAWV